MEITSYTNFRQNLKTFLDKYLPTIVHFMLQGQTEKT
jgi:hypothetical protein